MYYCFRCGKQTKTKSNLNSHLRNKKKCDIKYMYISRKSIINEYEKYLNEYFTVVEEYSGSNIGSLNKKIGSNMIQQNSVNSLLGSNNEIKLFSIDDKQTDKIICEYCKKEFTLKTNYYRHKKKRCKVIKQHQIMDEFLQTKYDLLKLEYEEKLKAETEKIEEKLKEKLEDKIKDLESRLVPSTSNTQQINNGHIGDNNGHIGDNITNITINNFGEEKFNISAQDCEKIMSHEFDMIVKLIEYIHIIPPENRNAFIPSLKEKYAMIMRNQKWDLVDRREFINDLVISKNVMLEKLLDEYGPQFENVNPNRSRSVINYCKNDEEEYGKIKTNTNLLLYNNKDLVKNTFENNYNKKIKGR
jgi:hypothetical protein